LTADRIKALDSSRHHGDPTRCWTESPRKATNHHTGKSLDKSEATNLDVFDRASYVPERP
ncbi:hypothetical protein, partial [Streptomyces sp. SID4982]|uniref:hypothetical protein n=1 Tax=Streptomyces sp. SID4982 TaxID=2690291 RepID=UPI001F34E89D